MTGYTMHHWREFIARSNRIRELETALLVASDTLMHADRPVEAEVAFRIAKGLTPH